MRTQPQKQTSTKSEALTNRKSDLLIVFTPITSAALHGVHGATSRSIVVKIKNTFNTITFRLPLHNRIIITMNTIANRWQYTDNQGNYLQHGTSI